MSEKITISTTGDVVDGKYLLEEELGRGAYGVVFKALQQDVGRHVALKTLLPQAFLQPDIIQRFEREAQLTSRLDHPNVIRLFDFGVQQDLLYMAVEFVDGPSLEELIKTEAPLPPATVRSLMNQLLDALDHAHSQGIIHRDLKPANVLLERLTLPDGSMRLSPKILDFGIAKLKRDQASEGALKTLTQDGTVLGTPHYMSPESIIGDTVDHRADLYAAGIILFEMLTGTHPFDAKQPSAVMVKHLRDDPPPLPTEYSGSAFEVAIDRCLVKQPLDRVESAAAIQAILDGLPAKLSTETPDLTQPAMPVVKEEKAGKPTYAWPVIALLSLVLVVSVGAKFWFVAQQEDPDPVLIGQMEDAGADLAGSADAGAPKDAALDATTPSADAADARRGDASNDASRDTGPDLSAAKPNKDTPKSRPKQRDKKPEFVSFSITSVPSRASVTLDGRAVGSTPVTQRVKAGTKAVVITFKHIGYKEKVLKVTPGRDQTVSAKLEKDRIKLIQ